MLSAALVLAVVGPGNQPPKVDPNSGIRGIGVSATALIGTGVSIAPGPQGAIANRSPAQLTVDAGFINPEFPWLEFSPAVLLELERGVGFGAAFRLRAFMPTRVFRPYVMAGPVAFLAPYKLYGVQLAVGAALQLHRSFALAVEFGPSVFFAGDDLTLGDSLTKLDGAAGIRVTF